MTQTTTQTSLAIVLAHGQNLFVDTNVMAELFDRPHKNLIRDVDKLVQDGVMDRLSLEPISYPDSYGRPQPGYRLSERDAMVLMPFLGGKRSAQGQAKLVDEFMRMRSELRRLAGRKTDPVLQLALKSKSVTATLMTDCLVDARAALGKDTKPHHFANEHSLCNWVLSGCYGHVDDADLCPKDLIRLASIRRRNTVLIVQGMSYAKRKDVLREAFPLLEVIGHG
ncbi:MAG: Rha family transcriptional regulator [Comamonadaceae bacterium]|nr:Rha family transcriptional regulator [Comamonadaceae bacterium]